MVSKKNTVALIPLRGGSKGVPGKNIKELHGRPLCYWVLKAATGAQNIDAVYVSTDSLQIIEAVRSLELDVKIVERPSKFASDKATTESVMRHFAEQIEFETLVTIQATSPLLHTSDLETALCGYKENNYDSMLSGYHSHDFVWGMNGQPLNYDPRARPRRQDWGGAFVENGAFYITSRDVLVSENCRLGGLIGLYEMDRSRSVDIDTAEDFDFVEALMNYKTRNDW